MFVQAVHARMLYIALLVIFSLAGVGRLVFTREHLVEGEFGGGGAPLSPIRQLSPSHWPFFLPFSTGPCQVSACPVSCLFF
jgi:hypothetical protein